MKFFTIEWATGQLSDDESERRPANYQAHLAALGGRFTAAVNTLISDVNIHDGLIQEVAAEQGRGELSLELVCGDLQVGYSDVNIVYRGVEWSVIDLGLLQNLANNVEATALYDEVHLGPSATFEHHILFWPYSALVVRFSDVSVSSTPRGNPADRSLRELADRFSVKP